MLSEDAACLNSSAEMDMVDDELTDDHMRLLEWLTPHGITRPAAQALDLAVSNVEGLCSDLMDAGMIERTLVQ